MNPTKQELEAAGYESLTYEYWINSANERWMLNNAVAQLDKGGRDYKVFEGDGYREIFVRKQTQP